VKQNVPHCPKKCYKRVSTGVEEPRLGDLNVWQCVIPTRQIKWNSNCSAKFASKDSP
jgi:hypothetical protein